MSDVICSALAFRTAEPLEDRTLLSALSVKHAPYLQLGDAPLGSSTDQIEVLWQTVPTGTGSDSFAVSYRAVGTSAWTNAAAPTEIDTGVESRVVHSARIAGLTYDRDYEYRVQQIRGGSVIQTWQDTFHTRLAQGNSTDFSFAAYGDSADLTTLPGFREVQDRINQLDASSGIAFSLLLGDNVYENGTHQEFDARLDPTLNPEQAAYVSSHVDYYAMGNHDSSTLSGQPSRENFSVPRNGPASETSEENYSFDYGSVHFATFDSNSLGDANRLGSQLDWLVADMQASTAKWKIVFAHHPIAGVPDKAQGPSDNYYQQVVSRLRSAGVDLFLVGHSHTYGWTYPLLGQSGGNATFVNDTDLNYAEGAGLIQVVAGVGGHEVRSGSFSGFPFVAAGYSSSTSPQGEDGIAKIDVTSNQLTVSYVAADNGAVLGSFTITAGSSTNQPPSAVNNSYSLAKGGTLDANDSDGSILGTNNDSVLLNDTDPEIDPLTAVLVSGPTHASSFSLNANGTFSYVHNNDAATSDTFTYRASDGSGTSNIATATIAITGGGGGTQTTAVFQDGLNGYAGTADATIRSDKTTTNEGSAATLQMHGLTDKSALLSWNVSSIAPGATVQSATLTINVSNLSDDNTYPIYALLKSWNEGQVTWNQAASGSSWTGAQGSSNHGSSPIGSIFAPTTGLQTFVLDTALVQSWINSPATNHGIIVQNYDAIDGLDFSSSESTTVANRPKLTITYSTGTGSGNNPPTANANGYSVGKGLTLTANDTNGSVSGTNNDSVLLNDTDPENNPLSTVLVSGPSHAASFTLNTNGTFTYTHNNDAATTDTFTYRANDGTNNSNLATVTISITPTNNPPTANPNSYTLSKGQTLAASDANGTVSGTNNDSVLLNDTDPENNPLTAVLVSNPLHARSFTFNPNGTFSYTHNNDTATNDTFTYRATDGANSSNIATVTITISGGGGGGGTQTTVSFQDGVAGYAGTTDATIRSDKSTNEGSAATLQVHGLTDKAALLRWNLSSIPTSATVTSATVTVNVTNLSDDNTYPVYALLKSWNESQVTWSQAASGSSWTGAQSSSDRNPTPIGSIFAPSTGLLTFSLNAAQVQSWINSPSTNQGIIVQNYAAIDGLDFSSSEAATVANRPKLTITYTTGSPLLAAESSVAAQDRSISVIDLSDLQPAIRQASSFWLAATPMTERGAVRDALDSLTFAVADLPGRVLGTASGRSILIDRDAAGFGWFVGPLLTRAAQERMDLLSVVAHEIGHALGYEHDDGPVMRDVLQSGTRTLPIGGDGPLDTLFSDWNGPLV